MISDSYLGTIFAASSRNGILLDTELLLLLCVGIFDCQRIKRFKRTMKFDIDDFDNVQRIAGKYKPVYVSPHVLAELSNLSNALPSEVRNDYFISSKRLIRGQFEVYIPKESIIDDVHFPVLGVADVSILLTCMERKCVLFTSDSTLTQIGLHRGIKVLNYRQFRDMW